MRCKNCGSQNEDGRYICQNCGSPLYDELDEIPENGEFPEDEYDDEYYEKKATRKSIIIIAVLVVVLAGIITGVVFALNHTSSEPETSESTSSESTSDYADYSDTFTTESTTESTTKSTTESTTESTTKATTEKTTESTTKKAAETKYRVSVDIDGSGSILGDGEYTAGKRVTLNATADANAQFVGWYENGRIVASGTSYSFVVNKDRALTAVFQDVPEEITDEQPSENE